MTAKTWTFLVAALLVIASSNWCECKAQVGKTRPTPRPKTNQHRSSRPVRASTSQSEKKVVDIQKILNDMPKELQPRDGEDEAGMFARDKANKWLENNLIGQTAEFKTHIRDVKISPTPTGGQYTSRVSLTGVITSEQTSLGIFAAGTVRSGGVDWKVYYVFRKPPGLTRMDIDEATAKSLLNLKDKPVTISGKLAKSTGDSRNQTTSTDQLFHINPPSPLSVSRPHVEPKLNLYLLDASVEGLDLPKQVVNVAAKKPPK